MAVKKTQTDQFSNILLSEVVESAANTLTFVQLPQVTTLMDKKAYLLNRLEYITNFSAIVAANDSLKFGLSMANTWTVPDLTETTIIDYNYFTSPGVSVEYRSHKIVNDLSELPGGGMLVPSRAMYLFVEGGNLAGAQTVSLKMYFTMLDLDPSQYWDLVEALQAYT